LSYVSVETARKPLKGMGAENRNMGQNNGGVRCGRQHPVFYHAGSYFCTLISPCRCRMA
jgi:hypothetical protein